MELSVKRVANTINVRLYASLAQATRPWATQTPAKKKREDIHVIDTADQSAKNSTDREQSVLLYANCL